MKWTRETLRADLVALFAHDAQAETEVTEQSHLVADPRHRLARRDGSHRRHRGQVKITIPDESLREVDTIADVAKAIEFKLGIREASRMSSTRARTLVEAIEDAAASTKTGYRFIEEGSRGRAVLHPRRHRARERPLRRRAPGARLKKGDRVALILPDNARTSSSASSAPCAPASSRCRIYPPLGLGQLQGYLDNTRHIVAKTGARALVTNAQIKRMLGTVQAASPELEQVVAVEAIRESLEPLKPAKVDRRRRRVPPVHERLHVAAQGRDAHPRAT